MDFSFLDSGSTDLGFPGASPGLPAFGQARDLSRMEKAAVVVRLLIQAGVEVPLAELPEDAQDQLILNMSRLKSVDRDTVQRVVDEFAAELDTIGLLFPRGMGKALETLGNSLSPTVASRARAKLGLGDTYDPWERLNDTENERIVPLLQKESAEVSAIVLSKLKVAKSAEILGMMPGRQARAIAFAMSTTSQSPPELVNDIGRALFDQLRLKPTLAFEKGPVEMVGAILNSTGSGTRDDILEGLDEADKPFADQVRKSIFTFENIPARIDPRDVPKILRKVEPKDLQTALAVAMQKADDKVAPFIFANMSSRMAQSLKEDIEGMGKIKDKDAEAATNAVVSVIRTLADEKEIFFRTEEEAEAE